MNDFDIEKLIEAPFRKASTSTSDADSLSGKHLISSSSAERSKNAMLEASSLERERPSRSSRDMDRWYGGCGEEDERRHREHSREKPEYYARSRSPSYYRRYEYDERRHDDYARHYHHHHSHYSEYYRDCREPSSSHDYSRHHGTHYLRDSEDRSTRSRSSEKEEKTLTPSLAHSTPSSSSPTPSSLSTALPLLTEAQRDRRTVFCRQLAQRLGEEELKRFCEQAGPVRDARLVYDKMSRRSKGVAYVEFCEEQSVAKAVALTGTKLLGIPIIIELTETEKNRIAEEAAAAAAASANSGTGNGAVKKGFIEVANLPLSMDESEVRRLFSIFGFIQSVTMELKNVGAPEKQAILAFNNGDIAKVAADRMKGYLVQGKTISVSLRGEGGFAAATSGASTNGKSQTQQTQQQTTRPSAKESSSFEEELAAVAVDSTEALLRSARDISSLKAIANATDSSPCLLMTGMYDPERETAPDWDREIAQEVREETAKYGSVLQVQVPKTVDGDVIVRFADASAAAIARKALDRRWFGGKQISVLFVPLAAYLRRYPN